jgi:hypothetical protein
MPSEICIHPECSDIAGSARHRKRDPLIEHDRSVLNEAHLIPRFVPAAIFSGLARKRGWRIETANARKKSHFAKGFGCEVRFDCGPLADEVVSISGELLSGSRKLWESRILMVIRYLL